MKEKSDEHGVKRDVAVILAAGMGTRMASSRSKVLHPLLGRPMVGWVVAAAQEAGLDVVVVVHHQEEQVRAALAGQGVAFARQEAPRGTGDALRSALSSLPAEGRAVVLAGDTPLFRASTLQRMLEAHGQRKVTVLSALVPEGGAYGRLVREAGRMRIVEAAECSPEQAAIREINTGAYVFDLAFLHAVVPGLAPHPPKGEIYLTDCLELAAEEAGALLHPELDEVMGVNDRVALAEARQHLQARILRQHALAGVTFEGQAQVEVGVRLGRDVTVGQGCVLRGQTLVGDDVVIDVGCVIDDSTIEAGARLRPYSTLEGARVGRGALVGPFARLRPEAQIDEGAHIGNFVEVKKARIERGAKVNHLTYIGDARVGEGANVGAGTITCNYDGYRKSHTDIGKGAFIGSNTALVAPVKVGDGAIVGAGSVITRDVPADALAVERSDQRSIEGWAPRFRASRGGVR